MPAKDIFEFSVPILCEKNEKSDSGHLAVKGIAINEVITRNNVKYTAEELQAAAGSLQGRPILKDHNNSVDSIVGKVKASYFDAMAKNVQFEGEIFDERVKTMIREGLINHVSIGARVKSMEKVKEEKAGDEYILVKGVEFLELSLVAVPGDPGASISQAFEEAFRLNESNEIKKEELVVQDLISQENKEGKIMEESVVKQLEEKIKAYEAKELQAKYEKYVTLCKEMNIDAEAMDSMSSEVLEKTIVTLEKAVVKFKKVSEEKIATRARVVNEEVADDSLSGYAISESNGYFELFKMPQSKGVTKWQ